MNIKPLLSQIQETTSGFAVRSIVSHSRCSRNGVHHIEEKLHNVVKVVDPERRRCKLRTQTS